MNQIFVSILILLVFPNAHTDNTETHWLSWHSGVVSNFTDLHGCNCKPCPTAKRTRIKPASFSMIYWKQQLILIKSSQNIKLTEPTAVLGIHNSWLKSLKVFILTDFFSGFENFLPFYTCILIMKSLK